LFVFVFVFVFVSSYASRASLQVSRSEMAGHLFVLRGDIRALACDAWLLPADRHQNGGSLD
jgi:hypothetical protein